MAAEKINYVLIKALLLAICYSNLIYAADDELMWSLLQHESTSDNEALKKKIDPIKEKWQKCCYYDRMKCTFRPGVSTDDERMMVIDPRGTVSYLIGYEKMAHQMVVWSKLFDREKAKEEEKREEKARARRGYLVFRWDIIGQWSYEKFLSEATCSCCRQDKKCDFFYEDNSHKIHQENQHSTFYNDISRSLAPKECPKRKEVISLSLLKDPQKNNFYNTLRNEHHISPIKKEERATWFRSAFGPDSSLPTLDRPCISKNKARKKSREAKRFLSMLLEESVVNQKKDKIYSLSPAQKVCLEVIIERKKLAPEVVLYSFIKNGKIYSLLS